MERFRPFPTPYHFTLTVGKGTPLAPYPLSVLITVWPNTVTQNFPSSLYA